jgi:hypothetical protein
VAGEVQPQSMTEAEWRAFGERLFGPDLDNWRFKCPTCGHVMSICVARDLSPEQKTKLRAGRSVEQECVGRYVDELGCNWCAYGLFSGPFFVEREGGGRTPVFGFDIEPALGSSGQEGVNG